MLKTILMIFLSLTLSACDLPEKPNDHKEKPLPPIQTTNLKNEGMHG